jgi:hypothetical protein
MSKYSHFDGNTPKFSRFRQLLPLFAVGALILGGLFAGSLSLSWKI